VTAVTMRRVCITLKHPMNPRHWAASVWRCLLLCVLLSAFQATYISASSDENLPIKQLLPTIRPFLTISAEYLIYLKGDDGKWIKSKRERVTCDVKEGKTRIETVERISGDLSLYRLSVWNGQKTTVFEYNAKFNQDLVFPDVISSNSRAVVTENKLAVMPNPFLAHWFGLNSASGEDWLFYGIKKLLASGTINNPVYLSGGARIMFSSNFNKIDNISIIVSTDQGPVPFQDVTFLNQEIKDGWTIPTKLIYSQKSENKQIRSGEWLYTVDVKDVSLNAELPASTFEMKLPVGCRVQDNITNTTYTVDGVTDVSATEQNIVDRLDEMLKKK